MALGRFRFEDRKRALWPVCMAAAAALALPFLGYVTDDTFIYLQFAGNLAAGHGFSFNAGEAAYGFTSPLWTILLAAGARCGFDPLVVAKILGGVFLVASVPAFAFASRRIIPSVHGRMAALAVWTSNAWMIRWSLSGMETALAVFLVLASVAAWMADRARGRLPFLPACLMGLAALTRPECLGLAALAGLDALLHSGRRRLQTFAALATGFAAVTIPWALYANAHFGTLLPHTVHAKGGAWSFNPADLAWAAERVAAIVCATSIVETSAVLVASMMALRALAPAGIREWLRIRFLPVAWTVSLLALYSLRGESALVSRYLLPAICWIVLFGFAAADTRGLPRLYRILRERAGKAGQKPADLRHRHRLPDSAAPIAWIFAAVVFSQNILMLYCISYPSAMRVTKGLRGPLTDIAVWIRENTPPGATIGLLDIGVIGYYSDRRVVDFHGHLDRDMHLARGRKRIEAFVESLSFASVARPDYVVDRWTEEDRRQRGDPWVNVGERMFTARVGDLGIARRAEFLYTVYRMHWDRYDAGIGHSRVAAPSYLPHSSQSSSAEGGSSLSSPILPRRSSMRLR